MIKCIERLALLLPIRQLTEEMSDKSVFQNR